jgi:hypothetical protein
VTSGSENGTSGEPRGPGPWLVVALIGVVVAFINATSDIMEIERAGSDRAWWEPVLWEGSSAAIIVAMAPLIGWAIRRWPPRADNMIRVGLIHIGLTVPYALIHVAFIFVVRESVYWLAQRQYGYFDDGIALVILYEWRKDILSYAAIAAAYWLHDYVRARQAATPTTDSEGRIEVRDGASTLFLAPSDILLVEAAGNYVEIHSGGRIHLVRGTLAAWDTRLAGRGFVRAHRSRLINRAHIRALKPTASGDLEITLDDGRTIAGSRRYRDALEGA